MIPAPMTVFPVRIQSTIARYNVLRVNKISNSKSTDLLSLLVLGWCNDVLLWRLLGILALGMRTLGRFRLPLFIAGFLVARRAELKVSIPSKMKDLHIF